MRPGAALRALHFVAFRFAIDLISPNFAGCPEAAISSLETQKLVLK